MTLGVIGGSIRAVSISEKIKNTSFRLLCQLEVVVDMIRRLSPLRC
ncbi:MAG: hypothetical protein JXM69_12225 [Anaerolineae bacterium]|nr:hypothetical protein [Anaerolineae bacterium]